MKPETTVLKKENIGENIYNLELSKYFLTMTSKAGSKIGKKKKK